MKRVPRGRPLKYGRPSRAVAVTLPEDTIHELQRIHTDIGRAIVGLVHAVSGARDGHKPRPLVEFERFARRRSLIVVDRDALGSIPGCELVPISDDRALLAMDKGRGLPDLELAVIDRLAEGDVPAHEREGLEALRSALMECRRATDIEVESRSIFVVEKSSRPR
jgi:hypothetical protein